MLRSLVVVLYAACIPAANWMIGHVGMCASTGPCVVPVWPGVYAPSGVVLVGLALCLRDAVQVLCGKRGAAACLVAGAAASWFVASPALATASAAAFVVSELSDWAVYGAVEHRWRRADVAVLCSGMVGLAVDSVLFLAVAFGSLDYLGGQVLGKAWAVLAVSGGLWAVRRGWMKRVAIAS